MAATKLPLPSLRLASRTGPLDPHDPMRSYEEIGLAVKQTIVQSLPSEWTWQDRRALDFGCGAGRVLRHFAHEASEAEIWGCDIDQPSIDWMQRHICPPFRAFTVGEDAGLPQPNDYFDLVWAMSVFTHLNYNWAPWLVELHRVLTPGGYLIASFLGTRMSEALLGEPSDEEQIGMNVVGAGRPWNEGGPWVFHSEWWIRAHWGRAFEIAEIRQSRRSEPSHGIVLMRKKPVAVSIADLERLEDAEPRELVALRHNIRQLHDEDRRLREAIASGGWRTALPARISALASRGRAEASRVRSRVGGCISDGLDRSRR